MKALWVFLPACLAMLTAVNCAAADFDGSRPFLCATVDVASCAPGQGCTRESAQTVNAPPFFTVDVAKKLVSETGTGSGGRSSKIDHVEHQSGLLLLSGTDGAQRWTASVGETNGKLSYAVIGDRMSVVAFGSCLVEP
jgi:hypothetical protein